MIKISGLLCLAMAVAAGTMLFNTSQSVQHAEQSLSSMQEKMVMEKESLRVLTAEWDYLNRPERLEKLTLENLDLDESLAEKDVFIDADKSLPEPKLPVLPRQKPKDLLLYASTAQSGEAGKDAEADRQGRFVQADDVIKSGERERFSDVATHEEGVTQ
jgi:hypothetical protein